MFDPNAEIEIALFASETSSEPIQASSSWEGLTALLVDGIEGDPAHRATPCTEATCGKPPHTHPKVGGCVHKYGPSWSPVTYAPGATRGLENVETVNALVLDVDHLPDEDATVEFLDRLRALELAWLAHSTHSHQETDQCFRVVLALSEPVPGKLWPEFRVKALEYLNLPADRATKDASRLFFLPSHPGDSECWWGDAGAGGALDVRAILGRAPAKHEKREAQQKQTGPTPESPRAGPVEPVAAPVEIDFNACLDAVARMKRQYAGRGDKDRFGLLKRILEGVPLATKGSRDALIHQACSILAVIFPPNTPPLAAVETLRRSITAMEGDLEPEGLEHWLTKASDSYERRHEERLRADAERDAVNARISKGLRDFLPRVAEVKARADDPRSAPADPEEEPEPDAWMAELIVKPVKDASDDPAPLACEHNAVLLLENLPEWQGHIRWNDLVKDIEITGGPLPANDRHSSVLDVSVSNWLHSKYGLHVKPNAIGGPILIVARRHPVDPVVDYLDGLRWGGTAQLHRVLLDHANARTVDRLGRDVEAHIERITRKWFVGACVRALRPGSQVDSVLVLEGKMGRGKTSFFRILGGPFFAGLKKAVESKDSTLLLARSWIVEMGELAGVRMTERESLNNEITESVDHIRPPYGRSVEAFPRRCVFGGTTEDEDWLVSLKGSRRWWPVPVGDIDLSWLRAHRDELWAEAAEIAREALEVLDANGGDPAALPERLRWWLSGDEEAFAHDVVAARYEASTVEHAIRAWWFAIRPDKRPMTFTTQTVFEQALKMTSFDKTNRALTKEVNEALANLGFEREALTATPGFEGSPIRSPGWTSTEELRGAARSPGTVLTLKDAGRGAA